jgi:2-polyprenyl-6-methoxyphenol hydroxylase-like FAD-dependent oxidoreductase
LRRLNILISGAGIAGCALAYWLARHGHAVTVVERGGALRSSGAPVDVRGRAAKIAEEMGIVPRLRDASIHVSGIAFLDRSGQRNAWIDLEALRGSIAPGDIELPRGDLATILHEACRNDAEFVFGDSVASLSQDANAGVDVTFEHAQPRRFDLVVGADGLHSRVRRLAFGPEADFVRHAGLYVATLPLPRDLAPGREMMMLNAPGKCVALHPSRDTPIVLFVFWHPTLGDFDHADVAQHKRILAETYSDFGWKVPAFLDAVRASDDLYFDAVSRVDMPEWSSGRVALVGDAASCVSLFGDGSTLAICGGYTLAAALAEHPDDHAAAFRRYREEHGKLVAPRQKGVRLVASVLVPRTQFGISARNRVLLRALSAFGSFKRFIRR